MVLSLGAWSGNVEPLLPGQVAVDSAGRVCGVTKRRQQALDPGMLMVRGRGLHSLRPLGKGSRGCWESRTGSPFFCASFSTAAAAAAVPQPGPASACLLPSSLTIAALNLGWSTCLPLPGAGDGGDSAAAGAQAAPGAGRVSGAAGQREVTARAARQVDFAFAGAAICFVWG